MLTRSRDASGLTGEVDLLLPILRTKRPRRRGGSRRPRRSGRRPSRANGSACGAGGSRASRACVSDPATSQDGPTRSKEWTKGRRCPREQRPDVARERGQGRDRRPDGESKRGTQLSPSGLGRRCRHLLRRHTHTHTHTQATSREQEGCRGGSAAPAALVPGRYDLQEGLDQVLAVDLGGVNKSCERDDEARRLTHARRRASLRKGYLRRGLAVLPAAAGSVPD
jgi:hypothetical protein